MCTHTLYDPAYSAATNELAPLWPQRPLVTFCDHWSCAISHYGVLDLGGCVARALSTLSLVVQLVRTQLLAPCRSILPL